MTFVRSLKLNFSQLVKVFVVLSCTTLLTYFFLCPCVLTFTTLHSVYYQTMCSVFVFSYLVYTILSASIVFYILANTSFFVFATATLKGSDFNTLNLSEISHLVYTFPILTLLYYASWVGPSVIFWFGHLMFSSLQFKFFYIVSAIFITYLLALSTSLHISSVLFYDYIVTIFHLWGWMWMLFFSNNLFSLIFFIEILSISVMLLLTTHVFTSAHFYSLTSYTQHTYFHHSYPASVLHTLLTFFWMTLVSSLLLFLFVILFYTLLLTFELNVIGSIFTFLVVTSEILSLTSLSVIWFLFVLCVFIKGGVVPFYIWKPSFFKGISYTALFFYVYVYYFSLFIYLIYWISLVLNELLLLYMYLLIGLVSLGSVIISGVLFESFYVKAFIALSSILNSLIIFFAITSLTSCTDVFLPLG